MENEEMIEKIGEGVVNDMLTETNSTNGSNGLIIIGGLCLLTAGGYGIYRLVKHFKNKKKYIELTPEQLSQVQQDDEEIQE